MNSWRSLPTHTVVAMQELCQQMLPPQLYHQRKSGKGGGTSIVVCRMSRKSPESVPHVLAGCGSLALTKYLARHNAALKILFFYILKDLEFISKCLHGIQRPNPNLRMRMAERKLYGMYRFMQTALRWGPTDWHQIDARIIDKEQKRMFRHWNELSLAG